MTKNIINQEILVFQMRSIRKDCFLHNKKKFK